MFKSARIKLTAWYLLIIMLISLSFSMVIYRALTFEFERFERTQRYRIEHRFYQNLTLPPNFTPLPFDPDLINETKNRLILILFLIDSGIFIISGGVGYFLAGRTLKPIQDMVDEQNRFISDSSHELRTPLTALKTNLEVTLRDQKLTVSDAKAVISDSISEVDRLQSLSDELLQLAQYQHPNNGIKFENFLLSEIINEAVKKISPLAREKKLKLIKKITDAEIKGIKYSLIDLIVILLDNSIKYSQPGKQIEIATEVSDRLAIVSVTDRGIGIGKEDIPHIFDRFFRADSVRSRSKQGGYGLGLSIAKKIIQLHSGTIDVKSEPKNYTVFTVGLPVA